MLRTASCALASAVLLTTGTLVCAQNAPQPLTEDKIIELSPFQVQAARDAGYLASSTLAGSRLNTSLLETPASISVMTKDFLDDIAATNIADALTYAVNAEPDLSDGTGNPGASGDLPLAIRGFGGSSLARNYFQWGLESDTYNTERLDFSRGPNSILFGTGGPGGIINTSTKRAVFGREITQIGLRLGSWEQYRGAVDIGRKVSNTLAVRVNGMLQTQKSWRDFVESDRKGAALAITYRPFKNTEIRFDGEYGEYERITTNQFLPGDAVSNWLAAGRPLSTTFGTVVPGTNRNTSRAYVHIPESGTVQPWFGAVNTTGAGNAISSAVPRAFLDFSVLPLKSALTGTGNRSDSRFTGYALFIEQRLGPVWIEAAASRQEQGRLWLSSYNWAETVLRADANALLPNGQPNPNAGKLYIESSAAQQTHDFTTDDLRLTGTYTLDLNKRSRWLGSWTVSGLLSRREGDAFSDNLLEVNTTPEGSATYPANLGLAANRIYRRTYIDPFGPGPKGGVDAREHPVRQQGVTSGFRRVTNAGNVSREILDTWMLAGQTKLLHDRLVVTGGFRHDEQQNFGGTATGDPVTGEWTLQTLNSTSTDFEGNTRTLGAVLRATSWASAFYNKSDNFAPQSTLTINGSQLGPRRGEGEDYGVKFRLLDGRLYATLTRYTTSEVNRQVFTDSQLISAINEIYEAIGDSTRVAGNTSRDSIDTDGKGYELELTANLTSQWRFTLNASRTQGTQSNNQPRNLAYVNARRDAWQRQGSLPLLAPVSGVAAIDPTTGQPSTVKTALDTIFDRYVGTILGANGVTRRQLREYNASVFTAYTIKTDSKWINGLTVGVGARYRDEPVVGYLRGGVIPMFGVSEFLVNGMAAKSAKLWGRNVRFQANLDNILNVNDPIVVDADETGRYRFLYPNPFRWSVSMTATF